MQLSNALILATTAPSSGSNAERAKTFFDSDIGSVISAGLVILGFIVVIFTIVKVVMTALKGNSTGAIKNLAIGLFVASILFNPSFIGNFIDWTSNVWEAVFGTAESITDKDKTSEILGG